MSSADTREPFSFDNLREERHYVPSEQGKQDYHVALITSSEEAHHRRLVVSMPQDVRNGTDLGVLDISLVVDEQGLVAGVDIIEYAIRLYGHSPKNPVEYYLIDYKSVNPTDHSAQIVSIRKFLGGWARDSAKLGEPNFEEMVARVTAETSLPGEMDWWETARMYATGMYLAGGKQIPLTAEHISASPVIAV